ncbi:MAG: ABC transporter permease [Clostridiales Family XIII bacterium]|jgi:ABC-2 type transport system permease protein|nr:ABC transporter permease [Clostridiales Family XIII bacterium]
MLRISLQWIRDYYRDGTAIFFGLLFPIVLVAVLGNMLANYDNADNKIGTLRIGYYAEEGTQAAQAVEGFAGAMDKANGVKLTRAPSIESAKSTVDKNKSDAALLFKDDLGVTVYEGGNKTKNMAANMIAQGFAREGAAYLAAYSSAAREDPAKVAALEKKLAALPTARGGFTADKKHAGRSQTMIDFYAVTMIVMICFMGSGIGAVMGIYYYRKEGLIKRLALSPKRGSSIFIESVLGCIPGNLAQVAAVMIPATFILGARYAADAAGNILLLAFFVLLGTTVTALFMIIGIAVSLKINPYLPIMAVLWSMLFASGSFNKQFSIPGAAAYMPPNIANRAVFELTMFGNTGPLLTLMAVLAVILAVACAVGSRLLLRKK